MAESYHSVAIIGAGLSGLYAAQLLKKTVPDVVLLEAQDRVGGRIKQVDGMTPWPLEAGPEFVHGRNSVFVRVAEQLGVKFGEKDWPDWWFFEGQGLVNNEAIGDEVNKVHELFDAAEDEPHPPPGKDVNVEEWMRQKGFNRRQMAVADACYANDFGCSLRQLGVRELIEENKGWDSGETYLLMDRSMRFIVQQLSKGLDIRTSWPVASVEYAPGGKGALVTAADGRRVRCRKVLVTASVNVLKDGLIRFTPQLPAPKLAALSRVRMGNVIKVLVTFSRRFWPEDMYDVICPGGFVPEFWMLKYPATNPGAGTPHAVVGFVAGERADVISSMEPAAVARAFASQLDAVFGSPADAHPASSSLAQFHVVDWSKEPWVRGGYTYPTLGAELGDRAELGAPVAGTLFFAGEAVNAAINPCIQGAMQTAEQAAAAITAALKAEEAPRSRL